MMTAGFVAIEAVGMPATFQMATELIRPAGQWLMSACTGSRWAQAGSAASTPCRPAGRVTTVALTPESGVQDERDTLAQDCHHSPFGI